MFAILSFVQCTYMFYVRRDEEDACLGTVRWLGRLPDMYGHQLVAGVFLVSLPNIVVDIYRLLISSQQQHIVVDIYRLLISSHSYI